MKLFTSLLAVLNFSLYVNALELKNLPAMKSLITEIKRKTLKDYKGNGFSIKKGEVTDFSVGSIQLLKKSKSDYKIEFTGVNIKVLADIAVKKKIMLMPEINAKGTAKVSVMDGSINQAVEIKKIGSKWKMNPKHCSSLIGDIKMKLDGEGIYQAIFSTLEKIFQKQAKGYLNKQICPLIKENFDKILQKIDVEKLLSLTHEEL